MAETIKNTPTPPIVSSDDDMEEPMTKDYSNSQTQNNTKVGIFVKPEFKEALESTLGNLPYDMKLGTPDKFKKVNEIIDITKGVIGQPLTEAQANQLVDMITLAPYNIIHKVIENIKTNQSLYFEVKKIGEIKAD